MSRRLVSTLSVLVFLALWELAPRLGLLDPRLVSQPARILGAGVDVLREGGLAGHLGTSLLEFVLGVSLALALGSISGTASITIPWPSISRTPWAFALYPSL